MAGGAARARIEVTPSSAAGRGGRGGRPAASDDDIAAIHAALLEHGVLFFREQSLTDDEHLDLARRFGRPARFPLGTLVGADGASLSYIVDSPESPPDADGWHTDITWIEEPPKMAFLQAVEIPALGGDTMWASLGAAYGALSPVMQQVCRQLRVEHVVHDRIIGAFERAGDELARRAREAVPARGAPARAHAPGDRARRALLGRRLHVRHRGMHADEGALLLDWLRRHLENPNFHVRWSWTPPTS